MAAPALTAGDGNITASWNPPSDDGGSSVTAYGLRWTKALEGWGHANEGSHTTGNASQTSHTITGLENSTEYWVQARAANGQGDGAWSATSNATTGAAAPPPNRAPVFDEGASTTRSIPENTPANTAIGDPVVATDPDGDSLTYSLGGTDAASFAIDAARGQLRTSAALDYEAKSSYAVQVTAADPSAATAVIAVAITVSNVDEDGTVTINSTSPEVRAALAASLADPDHITPPVAWQWAESSDWDGTSGTWADIAGATSASYTPASGNAGNHLRATASYTDGQGPGKSAYAVTSDAVAPAVPVRMAAPALTAGDGTITASWNPPSDDGGSSVTAYGLRWTKASEGWGHANEGSHTTGNASQTSHTITGLDNDAEYWVQARAANGQGDGAWSATAPSPAPSGNSDPPNDPPAITSTPPSTGTVTAGDTFYYGVDADDADRDALTFSLTRKPVGAAIDSLGGMITWTPGPSDTGTHAFTVSVADGTDHITQSFTVTVTDPPTDPAPPAASRICR